MSEAVFEFHDADRLGTVDEVDTAAVVVRIHETEKTRRIHVNRLVAIESSRSGQLLIGLIQKVIRFADSEPPETVLTTPLPPENDSTRITLIGTFVPRIGRARNVFRRSLDVVPEIGSLCWPIEGDNLTRFMRVLARIDAKDTDGLSLGVYSLDDRAEAYVDGDKLFQRHAAVVGSTGSGKSWTVARVVEQAAELPNANAILFDVHGEYESLSAPGIHHFRIAGPAEIGTENSITDGLIHLPFWLLGYEAILSLFVDRSDQNAPNQAMVFTREIRSLRSKTLADSGDAEFAGLVTIDSPVPFSVADLAERLNELNKETVYNEKTKRDNQGDFHGKLSRAIARLEAKIQDRRLGFLFSPPSCTSDLGWLSELVSALMAPRDLRPDKVGGIKIIDFSEVPSDVLPLMVSLVASLVFTVQQWQVKDTRYPIAIICEEAHLYIPDTRLGSADQVSVGIFERIAKEGRKYGTGLIVVSQRPSEVNRTVLSQCANLIAMRLTNAEDQAVIRRLLPDSLGGFGDVLPILDIGEALVVGDASLLPMRVRISEPRLKPLSASVDFWTRWGSTAEAAPDLAAAVDAWRRQSLS